MDLGIKHYLDFLIYNLNKEIKPTDFQNYFKNKVVIVFKITSNTKWLKSN